MSPETNSGNGKPDHLLALKGFSKSFGPVQALSDVDFEVDGGEVVALVGDNGAGKSTLIKAIDGVQPPDSGQAYFEGRPVKISDPNSATKLGIATVFQDLALCDNLDVVANLYLGQEVVGTGGVPLPVINETEMEQHTNELLDELSVTTLGSVRTEWGASPEGSASRSRSPAPYSAIPRSCCSMSRPRPSAWRRRRRFSASSSAFANAASAWS